MNHPHRAAAFVGTVRSSRSGTRVSRSPVLRQVIALPTPDLPTPAAVGADVFALRRAARSAAASLAVMW
ncbi:hypothetical protein [Dactylosporangium sp. NPDC000521]|uniref:hypothetical protein n=1 Tax=Dactylosporangium sp. NPDC000521 TaxID=3363975 RepID=UPI003673A043